jgi:hypothetical protein
MRMKQQLFDYEEEREMETAVSLRGQLELIQRMMFMALGAALTFLLFVIDDQPQVGRGGGILFLMLLLAPPAVSLMMLVSPIWRLLPLGRRVNTVMLGLGISWLALLIFYLASLSGFGAPLWLRMTYLLFTAGYLLLILGFWYFLQRRARAADESLFP